MDYPGSFGALPHLPQMQFASGESVPSRPPSAPVSRICSRRASTSASRAQSMPVSRTASPRDESQKVVPELLCKLNALRKTAFVASPDGKKKLATRPTLYPGLAGSYKATTDPSEYDA